MPRWYFAVAFVPFFAVLAWGYVGYRATAPSEAPIAAVPARDPGSLSGPTPDQVRGDRAREQTQRELVKLVTTLADGQRRLTDGLQTLREDLQSVKVEVRELQAAAAPPAARMARRKPRKPRPQPVSAVQPTWRWIW